MDDDSDDSSQNETLDQFREKWHKELNTTNRNRKETTKTTGVENKRGGDGDGNAKDQQVNETRLFDLIADRYSVSLRFVSIL